LQNNQEVCYFAKLRIPEGEYQFIFYCEESTSKAYLLSNWYGIVYNADNYRNNLHKFTLPQTSGNVNKTQKTSTNESISSPRSTTVNEEAKRLEQQHKSSLATMKSQFEEEKKRIYDEQKRWIEQQKSLFEEERKKLIDEQKRWIEQQKSLFEEEQKRLKEEHQKRLFDQDPKRKEEQLKRLTEEEQKHLKEDQQKRWDDQKREEQKRGEEVPRRTKQKSSNLSRPSHSQDSRQTIYFYYDPLELTCDVKGILEKIMKQTEIISYQLLQITISPSSAINSPIIYLRPSPAFTNVEWNPSKKEQGTLNQLKSLFKSIVILFMKRDNTETSARVCPTYGEWDCLEFYYAYSSDQKMYTLTPSFSQIPSCNNLQTLLQH